MKIIPITNARQNLFKIIEQTIKNSEPVQVTSKKGNAVIISEDDWNSIQETLYILSVPGMRESILKSDNVPLEQWKDEKEIGWDIQ